MSGEAAGWMTRLELSEDGQALPAHVEWADGATDAIKSEEVEVHLPEG